MPRGEAVSSTNLISMGVGRSRSMDPMFFGNEELVAAQQDHVDANNHLGIFKSSHEWSGPNSKNAINTAHDEIGISTALDDKTE